MYFMDNSIAFFFCFLEGMLNTKVIIFMVYIAQLCSNSISLKGVGKGANTFVFLCQIAVLRKENTALQQTDKSQDG